jgi:glycosyltransferase involved in cell wall biosynthesis
MYYLSIIVSFFNEKKYIKKYFRSHLRILNIIKAEVIYIDNNSNDGSYEILKNKIKLNGSFRLFKTKSNEISSPGLARNIGIRKAKGKYLLFLDFDDRLIIKKIKKITEIISQNIYTRIFLKKKTYLPKKSGILV